MEVVKGIIIAVLCIGAFYVLSRVFWKAGADQINETLLKEANKFKNQEDGKEKE